LDCGFSAQAVGCAQQQIRPDAGLTLVALCRAGPDWKNSIFSFVLIIVPSGACIPPTPPPLAPARQRRRRSSRAAAASRQLQLQQELLQELMQGARACPCARRRSACSGAAQWSSSSGWRRRSGGTFRGRSSPWPRCSSPPRWPSCWRPRCRTQALCRATRPTRRRWGARPFPWPSSAQAGSLALLALPR